MATGLYTVLSICKKRKKERWQISEERTKIFTTMSKKLKFRLYKKGLSDNVTLKLSAMNNQWLVIKTLTDDDTHKFPMCSLEIKELKQFLNANYPEL